MDNFDKRFNQLWQTNIIIMVIGTIISLAMCGFAGWVVIKLLQYFGVI